MTFLTTLGLENVSLEQQLERREKGQERESDGGVQKEEEGQRLDHRQDQDLGHLSVHDHSCNQHCLQQQQTPTNLQSNNKQILGKLCNLQQVNVTSKCKKKVSLQELKKALIQRKKSKKGYRYRYLT